MRSVADQVALLVGCDEACALSSPVIPLCPRRALDAHCRERPWSPGHGPASARPQSAASPTIRWESVRLGVPA
jgi:hypothetical protein